MAENMEKRNDPNNTPENKPAEKEEKFTFFGYLKAKRWPKVLLICVLVLCLAGTGVAIAFDQIMNREILVESENNASGDDGKIDPELHHTEEEADKYLNILLCGVDYKKNTARAKLTDVMMVIHLDYVNKTVDILQLPRDSYIGTDYKTGKLNAVYGAQTNGGIENLARKINRMLKLPIDHYVVLNMDGFEAIVDSIGGVTVDSPYSFTLEGVTIVKGVQTLNGRAANKFVRERHAYAAGDITRMKMQQIFLKAFVKKCLSLGKSDILKLAPKVFAYLTTDMTLKGALDIYETLSGLSSEDLNFHSCEITPFNDPYDGLSKLSLHAKPLADLLNDYFRENGEKIAWTELEILEYDTSYEYEGEQNQFQKENTASQPQSSSSSRPSSSSQASQSSHSSSSGQTNPSSGTSSTTSKPSDSSSQESSSEQESSEPDVTTSEPESSSSQESSQPQSSQESSEASSALSSENSAPSSEPSSSEDHAASGVGSEDTTSALDPAA